MIIIGKTISNKNDFFQRESVSVSINPKMTNRHGIIAGSTGSGKTVSLRVFLEECSKAGIPVLATDIKGDLCSIAEKADVPEQKISGWKPHTFPVKMWDVFGQKGEKLQASISEFGHLLLSKMLGLSDAQERILSVAFELFEDQGFIPQTLDSILQAFEYLGSVQYTMSNKRYGEMPKNSMSIISQNLRNLKRQGGDSFFNSSKFDLSQMLKFKREEGLINILNSIELVKYPKIYASFVIWILNKLYEELPEVGNLDKPKFIFCIDEAHLLFEDMKGNSQLLKKIEQAFRLIRSKGVGLFLITQNPADVPDSIAEQLGNRIIHAMYGMTPKSRRNIKTLAESFVPNPLIDPAMEIGTLGIGEALVSFLDETGRPRPVEKVKISLPQSKI